MFLDKSKISNEMPLENIRENSENSENSEKNVKNNVKKNVKKNVNKNVNKNEETNSENRFVKNSIDYSSYEPSHIESEGENKSLSDLEDNDLDELAILGFFNDFTLIDIGIHDLIREVYFEDWFS